MTGSRDALEAGFREGFRCRSQDIYMGFNYVYTWQCCVTRAYYPCGVCGGVAAAHNNTGHPPS